MMDEFAEKRGMVKMLLDMLKGSAAKEVSDGMKPPEGMPSDAKGLEIDKVSVMPHDKMDDAEPMSPEAGTMADEILPKGAIAEEMARAPEMAKEDDEEGEDSSPAFSSFMSKKKGKK